MWILTNIILILFTTIVGILLSLYLIYLIVEIGFKRNSYARKKCEEQKRACAENFKDKNRDNTKYRTAVLNTKNVVND